MKTHSNENNYKNSCKFLSDSIFRILLNNKISKQEKLDNLIALFA
jgi:hypothetical protein